MALTDEAVEKIKSMIVDGQLKPGDRLPREADLAQQLGLSRGSLREAVRALAVMRILDVRQGDGTYVTSLTPEILLEGIGFAADVQDDAGVLDLFELRRALEPLAAEKAALRMDGTEAQKLIAIADELNLESTVDFAVENDLAFHRFIAEASGNPVLSALIEGVAGRTHRARIWRGRTQPDAIERTRREHLAIATAIANGQPSVAAACTIAHISGIENWLRDGSHR